MTVLDSDRLKLNLGPTWGIGIRRRPPPLRTRKWSIFMSLSRSQEVGQEDLGITQSQEAQWEIQFEFLRFIFNFESGDQQMEKVPRQRDLHASRQSLKLSNVETIFMYKCSRHRGLAIALIPTWK